MYGRGMADILEGTAEFNRGHQLVTGEVPITVSDDARLDMFPVELVTDPDCPPAQAYLVNKDMFLG